MVQWSWLIGLKWKMPWLKEKMTSLKKIEWANRLGFLTNGMCVYLLGLGLPKMQEGEPFPIKASSSDSTTSSWADLDMKNQDERDSIGWYGEEVWMSEDFAFSKPEASLGSKYLTAFSEWLSQPVGWGFKIFCLLVSGRENRPSILTNLFCLIWSWTSGGDKVVEKNRIGWALDKLM